ncbi:uncharacterized protein EV420DRAFT_1646423 [Desarmillaria tabescens]|uniref:Uncharacterized protein n=1 Tax=Armillaria tabescens TaxID=1929756 RepID=A0AA39JX22_ARMTA|nr:uncharacterized protein EV420DRAFT_1646423 [Desarmillaria tabescens]KAK0450502.1 hypothetical protein EV420DRAFT_1646423 [Desarmillaria tabescens]
MQYSNSQRRYDSFRNEWDLNEEFDPTAHYDSDEDDDDDFDFQRGSNAHDGINEPVASSQGSNLDPAQELGRRLIAHEAEDVQSEKMSTATLEEVLYWFHGLQLPAAQSSETELMPVEAQKATRCKSSLACRNADRDPYNPRSEWVLSVLMNGLLSRGALLHGFPPDWSDFDPSCTNYLARVYNKRFSVSRVQITNQREDMYRISDGEETDYELIVGRASVVLLCLRQMKHLSLDEVAEYLCSWGIKLSTCLRVRHEDRGPRTSLRAVERIPYQVKGFQLGKDNYMSYVGRRKQLFRSNEVLRAALKHGGVPWRLAMEVSEDFVTSGPSSRVTEVGGFYKTEEGDELWDEMLTEDQINIICGVYKVEREESAGKSGKKGDDCGRLTEHVSWFLKDASWRGSGLDVGFWSADAESWYQRRVKKYLDRDFKCENQTEWKKLLKLWREAQKVAEHLETLSRSFLQCHVLHGLEPGSILEYIRTYLTYLLLLVCGDETWHVKMLTLKTTPI